MVDGDVSHRGPAGGLNEALRRLLDAQRKDILVGVPADKTLRAGESMNNASLLFIHTNGSPLRNIPARPVIEPALAYYGDKIAEQIAGMLRAAATGNARHVEQYMHRIGLAGQNAAREWFTNPANGWAPNSPLTVARKGSSQPLIDTGSLRKSMVYVIRGENE